MRFLIAVTLLICGGLYAESRTALGPRRIPSSAFHPASFRQAPARAPAELATEHVAALSPDLHINFDEHGLIV